MKNQVLEETNNHDGFDVNFWNKDISINVKFNTKDIGFGKGELVYHGKSLLSKADQLESIFHQLKEQRNQLDEVIKEIEKTYGKIIYTDKDTTK
jgi:hypothetical protein